MGIFHKALVGRRKIFIYVSDVYDGSLACPSAQVGTSTKKKSSDKDVHLKRRSILFGKLEELSRQAGGTISHRPVFMHQTHSITVRRIAYGDVFFPAEADAMITVEVPIAVTTADCVPLALISERNGSAWEYAVVHAGRVGLSDGIIQRTTRFLLASKPDRINVYVGPHICAKCYEVSGDLYDDYRRRLPGAAAISRWGTPAISLLGGVRAIFDDLSRKGKVKFAVFLLTPHGVAHDDCGETEAEKNNWCTYENKNFFSHRRFTHYKNKATRRNLSNNNNFYHGNNDGRFASVVWID